MATTITAKETKDVVHRMPKGSARVPPRPIGSIPDKGVTASAIAHASWTWGQGTYFPSNLIKTMAHCPRLAQTEVDYANAFIFDESSQLNGVQQGGFIDRCLKELLINAVAANNRCRYSLEHHSFIGLLTFRGAGREQEYLSKFLHVHEFDQFQQYYTALELSVLALTKKICRDPHLVSDQEFQELARLLAAENLRVRRGDGSFTDQDNDQLVNSQLVEITWLVSHFCLLTRWFTVLQVEAEKKGDEVDFLEAYRTTVPREIIERNNDLIGDGY